MSGPPVFVTGATGFVGTPLVRALRESGREVHALARPTSDKSRLAGLDVRWHDGDLSDVGSIERALGALEGRGAQLVHGAALISYRTRDRERAMDVNVEGTRRLMGAAVRFGVARVLFVSSVVAVGHAPDANTALDEDAPFDAHRLGVHYVTTKRLAEEVALACEGPEVVVVNPAAVFGAGADHNNTTAFVQRVASGAIGPFAPPGSLSVVGVDDTVAGALAALERGRPGRRYLLAESNWRLAELFAEVERALGREPRRRRTLPRAVWNTVVGATRLVDRVKPLELATPQSLQLLGLHFRFDASRAREELGWSPRPFPEVLAETVAWARERGLLD